MMARHAYRCHACGKRRVGVTVVDGKDLCPECAELHVPVLDTRWWSVTFRSTAEMTVWVQATDAADARRAADNVEYDDASDVEFVRGKPYTMKAKLAPTYKPPERY